MADELQDERWMSQALDLARQGAGLASPNPTVGCVIVRDGKVVGEGFHQYDLRDHAEVVALREAGIDARGATAYVTLEPCSHQGRTPPCADALIAAGVARAVVATLDANPQVHGQGVEKLRQAGIEVATGILEQPAREINNSFAKYIRTGLPYVTLKAAMSLDGRIAPPASSRTPGEVFWITGLESRQHVQFLRHSVDAVLTGIGTVLADDPLLTDRSGLPRRRPLLRVILDAQLRLPLDSKLVRSANEDVIVFCGEASRERREALSAAGITVKPLDPEAASDKLTLAAVLRELAKLQITSLMVEAGSSLNTSFLNEGVVDRLFLFYAPTLLGADGQPLVEKAPITPLKIQRSAVHRFGKDFACELRLREYWQNFETTAGGVGKIAAPTQD